MTDWSVVILYIEFDVSALSFGHFYAAPTNSQSNECQCNTVYYNLISACAYCQNGTYLEWVYLCPFFEHYLFNGIGLFFFTHFFDGIGRITIMSTVCNTSQCITKYKLVAMGRALRERVYQNVSQRQRLAKSPLSIVCSCFFWSSIFFFSFPAQIPSETVVPGWAYENTSASTFNVNSALEDKCEYKEAWFSSYVK